MVINWEQIQPMTRMNYEHFPQNNPVIFARSSGKLCINTFDWELSLGNLIAKSVALKFSLASFRLGTYAWKPLGWGLRLGARSLGMKNVA